MKKLFLLFSAAFLLFTSCKKKENLQFCEGKTPEGKGVNCGSIFSTGDVMILVEADGPFTATRLKFEIFEDKVGKKELRATRYTDVKPEDTEASTLIPLYSEGTFTIVASAGEKEAGRRILEIRHR